MFSCSKIEQKQLNTWVSFQSAEQPLLGQFSVSGNNRIQAGDVVFLYENGKGIVAYGTGTGVTEKRIHGGFLDECHFQRLDGFEVLPKPISASEIKKTLQKNVVLLRTMSAMPEGQLLLDLIKKRS